MIMVLNTIIFIIQSLMVSCNELDPRVPYFGSYFFFFFLSARPTDKAGVFASQYTEPEPWASPDAMPDNPWNPFEGRLWFDFAHHHFVRLQSLEKNMDISLDLLKAATIKGNGDIKFPWLSMKQMYETIDQIQAGPAPFCSYWFKYNGPMLPTPLKWMMQEYELYARDPRLVLQQQLATPEFSNKFDPIPYHRFNSTGDRVFSNLMSSDWAWDQAVTYSILSLRRYMAEHHVESDI